MGETSPMHDCSGDWAPAAYAPYFTCDMSTAPATLVALHPSEGGFHAHAADNRPGARHCCPRHLHREELPLSLPRLPEELRLALRAAILAQATSGLSNRQLATQYGVHYQTVGNIRREMEREGLITRLRRGVRVKALETSSREILSSREEGVASAAGLKLTLTPEGGIQLGEGQVATPEQILQKLTWLANSPEVPYPVQVQANRALYDISEQERARASLSREEPKNAVEAAERLLTLRRVVGPGPWQQAHKVATEEEEGWTAEVALRRMAAGLDTVVGAAASPGTGTTASRPNGTTAVSVESTTG